MKNLFLIIVFGFYLSSTNAQKYIPLPMENAIWQVWSESEGEYGCTTNVNYGSYNFYKTKGDTIINNRKYTAIAITSLDQNPCGPFGIRGAIRQDTSNRIVFIIKENETTEDVLYDFSLNINDTVKSALLSSGEISTVTVIDSILINGIYHRVIEFFNGFGHVQFIEGIGSNNGLLSTSPEPILNPVYDRLICLWHKGQIVYPDSLYISECKIDLLLSEDEKLLDMNDDVFVYPSVAYKNLTIKSNHPVKEINLINIVEDNIYSLKISDVINQNLYYEMSINLPEVPAGIYFIRVKIKDYNKIIYKKLIILK